MASPIALSNFSIVVTRPTHQNASICKQLIDLGANVIAFPCIEIHPNTKLDLDKLKQQLELCQIVLFISANAVNQLFKLVPEFNELVRQDCLICAVGSATAESLRNNCVHEITYPSDGFDSEQVLNLPVLQKIEQKMILIIKGTGGRELLYEEFQQRNALVENIEVYERHLPEIVDITPLTNKIDLILFTSSETVNNFLTLTTESLQESLLNCQTVVGHARIAEKVSTLGFKKLPIIAATPADADMLDAVLLWAGQQ